MPGPPAAALGDQVVGVCATHLIPGPLGAPVPGPPMPFSAPITLGVEPTVLAGGKPVVVVGAQGFCTPPHVGLHPADPFMAPPMQQATVTVGSGTVLAGGKPMARTGDTCLCCAPNTGQLVGTVATVLVGG